MFHLASTGPGEANTAKRLGTCEHHRETSGTVLGPLGAVWYGRGFPASLLHLFTGAPCFGQSSSHSDPGGKHMLRATDL